jgi:uncharacterized protein
MQADDVAQYLLDHSDFFELHPQLLERINLPHPQTGQTVSLIERQTFMLRDRIRTLELRLAEMIRHGQENDAIADRLVQWARMLLLQTLDHKLPQTAIDELMRLFNVPFGALRVWGVTPDFAQLPCATPVSEDTKRLATSMHAPFCGSNVGFEVAEWMAPKAEQVRSLALVPLRVGAEPAAFGILTLGSADPERFQISMGTEFLSRIGELASAALARMRAPAESRREA